MDIPVWLFDTVVHRTAYITGERALREDETLDTATII